MSRRSSSGVVIYAVLTTGTAPLADTIGGGSSMHFQDYVHLMFSIYYTAHFESATPSTMTSDLIGTSQENCAVNSKFLVLSFELGWDGRTDGCIVVSYAKRTA